AYRDSLGENVGSHVAAIEADSGGERPVGFGLGLGAVEFGLGSAEQQEERPEAKALRQNALATLREVGRLLEGIEAGEISSRGGGADISFLMREGVPGLGLRTVGERYMHWHHTQADTLDKVDPQNLRRQIAALAVMAYVLADMPERLVDIPAPSPQP
ncbi:MAG: M28 family peptidase, partial [Acidobacteria bacterium]|nr:M28 family peptidase [Acidobacteriota bacterium]